MGNQVTHVFKDGDNGFVQVTTGNVPAEGANPSVDHPAHYNQHPSGVECIDIVRWMGFNLGNVVKYLWRDGLKDTEVELQDLEKAAWYLNNEINRRKQTSQPPCNAYVGNPIIRCTLPLNHEEDHNFPEIDGSY